MKIAFIVPYFGKIPVWFSTFLISCERNPSIDWLVFTNCDFPEKKPNNVLFFKSSLQELQLFASIKMNFEVALNNTRKLCDLKPAYGDVFDNYLVTYDFWGFCDVDIVWGDIRKFITDDMLEDYDIITTLKGMISGHFSLLKNTKSLVNLYRKEGLYEVIFKDSEHRRFDEVGFSKIVKNDRLKVYWKDEIIENGIESEAHQEYYLDRWLWDDGKIVNTKTKKEFMYLHFINWKRTMSYNEVKYSEPLPNQFFISYNGMHFERHSMFAHVLNTIKNVFNGYYVRMERKLYVRKFNKFIVKFKRN
ncbi:DUF6625 family protein [Aestuariibaculum suncheonense]|uniref:Uncharacterized protein n=1 Tax=Aestuariibaculum suncheonense TaxID=1028745 RepID=A0A8J6UC81_9FLAO|nr:DUF6625 family protein [Aestuariibaculum suncheonense]MBD0837028.1 hypothetical protein [Aestuariibaculum suncheonense]